MEPRFLSPPLEPIVTERQTAEHNTMGRKPREIKIECVLESGGTERDLARWVAATKIVMSVVERAKRERAAVETGNSLEQSTVPAAIPGEPTSR